MKEIFFTRGIAEIIESDFLKRKLSSGKKLRIKYGVDPTRPDIHLGHAVGLKKLKELQNEGHTIIFLIGDYTSKIGDPSLKNKTRPVLTDQEITKNAKTYFEQVGKILDVEKTEIRYNSEWYKGMTFNNVLDIAGKFTVAQLIERDDFSKRLKSGSNLGLHELLYPVMQAYDSVVLKSDIEFGGTDQKFNMLAGRSLQKKMDQVPQDILTVKLLVGLDGKEKMSKSADNYIGITEDPNSQFGKIMSIPDSLIKDYFELCTSIPIEQIKEYENEIKSGRNPKEIKEILAVEIVKIYHGEKAAEEAKEEFEKVFSKRELPTDIPEIDIEKRECSLLDLLSQNNAFDYSRTKARRLIEAGSVKIDGQKITDLKVKIAVREGMIIQIGKKKFVKVR